MHTTWTYIGTGSHYRNGRKCSKEIISIMWCIYMNMAIVLCMNLGAYVGKPTSLLSHHFSVALLLSHAVTQIICWKDYRLETYINPSWKSLLHISVIDASIWTPATKKQKSFPSCNQIFCWAAKVLLERHPSRFSRNLLSNYPQLKIHHTNIMKIEDELNSSCHLQ